MKPHDDDLDQYARARLAYLTAGRPPLVTGPRRIVPAQDEDEVPLDDLDHLAAPDGDDGGAVVTTSGSRTRLFAFARSHLVGVAAVLALLLVVTAASLMRSRATTVPLDATPEPSSAGPLPTTITTVPPPASGAPSASTSTPMAAPSLQVHVMGGVRHPGVVLLRSGARAHDAISAAGGLSPDGATGDLNLAAPVADGDQLVVGTRAHPAGTVHHAGDPAPASAAGSAGAGTAGAEATAAGTAGAATAGVVDLNSATLAQLDQLPGVGPVTAQRILDFRTQHQRFTKVEELQEVDGIGPKTYERIAPHVRV